VGRDAGQAGPRDPRHVRAMSADLEKAQAEGWLAYARWRTEPFLTDDRRSQTFRNRSPGYANGVRRCPQVTGFRRSRCFAGQDVSRTSANSRKHPRFEASWRTDWRTAPKPALERLPTSTRPHAHQTRGCRRYTSSRTVHSAEHWRAPPLTAPHDAVPRAEMAVRAWNGPLSSTTSTSADSQFHQALAVAGRRRLGLCPRGSHGLQPSPPRRRRSCRSCTYWDLPSGRMPASQGVGR
jgi:hypothetical protein